MDRTEQARKTFEDLKWSNGREVHFSEGWLDDDASIKLVALDPEALQRVVDEQRWDTKVNIVRVKDQPYPPWGLDQEVFISELLDLRSESISAKEDLALQVHDRQSWAIVSANEDDPWDCDLTLHPVLIAEVETMAELAARARPYFAQVSIQFAPHKWLEVGKDDTIDDVLRVAREGIQEEIDD
jgi:hypothetical protein